MLDGVKQVFIEGRPQRDVLQGAMANAKLRPHHQDARLRGQPDY
jgi:hypothetical protein